MTTATIPTGSRHRVLEDLRRRRDRALEILTTAEDDGDEDRWRRATERFWLRELQLDAIEKRHPDDQCPRCLWGEEGWPAQMLIDYGRYSACLEHDTPRLERQAAEMAEQARWYGAPQAPATGATG